jgi:hypothetical protein
MTDNVAVLDGYTKELFGTSDGPDLNILVRPDSDLDGSFVAWDMDGQEYIVVNGWLFAFEEVQEGDCAPNVKEGYRA